MACTCGWVDITTAIGTAAAAVVALVVAVIAYVNSLSVRRDRATLVAARLSPHLAWYCDKLTRASTELSFSTVDGRAAPQREAEEFLSIPPLDIPTEELAYLASLPKRCAFRLAKGISLLEIRRNDICRESEQLGSHPTFALTDDDATRWASYIDEVARYFAIAKAECDRAAAVPAARPSGQELYGDE